jgi:hypothetical protein
MESCVANPIYVIVACAKCGARDRELLEELVHSDFPAIGERVVSTHCRSCGRAIVATLPLNPAGQQQMPMQRQ